MPGNAQKWDKWDVWSFQGLFLFKAVIKVPFLRHYKDHLTKNQKYVFARKLHDQRFGAQKGLNMWLTYILINLNILFQCNISPFNRNDMAVD